MECNVGVADEKYKGSLEAALPISSGCEDEEGLTDNLKPDNKLKRRLL